MKLNLGCGRDLREGWVNVDLYHSEAENHDARSLPYENATHILAKHLLEHFDQTNALDALRHWCQILIPEGTVEVIVPDLKDACGKIVEHGKDFAYGDEWWMTAHHMIFGAGWAPGEYHHCGWTEETLKQALIFAGFKKIEVRKELDIWCPVLCATAKAPRKGQAEEQ